MSLTDTISLPPQWWNISTSTGCLHNCKTTPRTCNGWKFSTHLPLRRISTYLVHLLLPTRQGKSDRCITCPGVFFWKISSRRNLSREPLNSLLLRDSSQVAQRPKSPNWITGSSLGLPFLLVLDNVGSLLETSLLTCYKQNSKNT